MTDEADAIKEAAAEDLSEAAAEDLGDVLALLDSTNLPREGVAEHLRHFLLARDASGRLIGCVGLERHGALGLLRSAAVASELRGSGLGTRLVRELLVRARGAGIEEMLLLTTTAREFFVRRFGFATARREDYEGRLAGSAEWNLPRCSTAALLRLSLK